MQGGIDESDVGSGSVRISEFNSKIGAVCHLALLNGEETVSSASGFLAKSQIDGKCECFVMTNRHFIRTKDEAARVTATFHFDGEKEPKCIKLNPDGFYRTDEGLDYTIVGISGEDVDDLKKRHGVSPVILEQVPAFAKVGDQVYIVQHPQGKQKRFSVEKIREVGQKYVGYKADTASGSSGSPVLCDQNGKLLVLALHKSGAALINGELVNKGILISVILDHVNGHSGPRSSKSPTTNNESGKFPAVSNNATSEGRPVHQPTDQPKSTDVSPVPSGPRSSKSPTTNNESGKIPALSNNATSEGRPVHQPTDQPKSTDVSPVPSGPPVQPCSLPFNSRELIRIAQRIGGNWQEVAKYTGEFEDWEITNILLSLQYHNTTLKADRMLNDYKSRLGTRQCLAKALQVCGAPDVAKLVLSGSLRNDSE